MARLSRRYLLMLGNQLEPITTAAFIESFSKIKNRARIGLITKYIEAGQVQNAIDAVGITPQALSILTEQVASNFDIGLSATADKLPWSNSTREYLKDFGKAIDTFGESWIKKHSGELVTDITNDQTRMIRNVIFDGMSEGRRARSITLDLVGRYNSSTGQREGGLIGLTKHQSEFVANARKQLLEGDSSYFNRILRDRRFDSTIKKSFAEGRLTEIQLDRILGRYADRLLHARGRAIARTEMHGALHAGQRQAINNAINSGIVSEYNVLRTWYSTNDQRTRDSHWDMNGEIVGWSQRFSNGLLYPGEYGGAPEEVINCRCWLEIYAVF